MIELINFTKRYGDLLAVDGLTLKIEPGEMCIAGPDGFASHRFAEPAPRLSKCIFEFIYFSRPDSKVFGENVDKIRSALLVAQGLNDPRVPASESEQIVAAVRKTGHEVWYMLARNEGHGFRRKENRDTYVMLLAKFFATHL